MEAPNNRRSRSMAAPKIECPQCKSEIKLARPRNLVVEAVRGVERLGSQLITPGALTVLAGSVYHSSMAWGVHSIYAVFGAEDGFRILRPLILNSVRLPLELENVTPRQVGERVLGIAVDHIVHWRLYVGLPLITPMLVLSRTTFADSILPVLPILFFATQTHSPNDTLDFGQWPPSASLAFAVLPYVRSAYNMYYQKVWAGKEKQWLKEIQPRVGQGQNEGGANAGNGNENPADEQNRINDDNVFEVRIDGGIWEGDEWEFEEDDEDGDGGEEDDDQVPLPDGPPPMQFPGVPEPQQPPPGPQGEEAQADPRPNIADNRAANAAAQQQQQPNQANPNAPPQAQQQAQQQPHQHQHQHQHVHQGERRLSFSPTAIAETVLGALVFPAIAGMSGELLKLALPKSWTTPSGPPTGQLTTGYGGPGGAKVRLTSKGLLQEKWGRSLVGGCLFVVLKDAVMLYVRWKMAQMHRRRRVLDFEKKVMGVAVNVNVEGGGAGG